MQPTVSIIVPVYNSEKSLDRCIQSVQNQSLKDFQLILVNDGSEDRSLEICNQYAIHDSRITVISQKNSGVTSARNTGLNNAAGEYIAFLDSDDYVDNSMYKTMVNVINDKNADIVTCGFIHVAGNESVRNTYKDEVIDCPKALAYRLVGEQRMASAVWNNLFRKSIIDEYTLRFNEVSVGEDLLFLMEYLLCCRTAVRMHECYYYYVENNDSIMHRLGIDDKESLLLRLPLKYEIFKKHNLIDVDFYNAFGMEYITVILKLIQVADYQEFKRCINSSDLRKHLTIKYCHGLNRSSFVIIFLMYYLKLYRPLYLMIKNK